MSHQVKVLVAGVTLPNGNTYFVPNTIVTLTDEQFDRIDALAFSSGKLLDMGAPPMVLTPVANVISTDADMGDHFRVVLTSNCTLAAPTNLTDGQKVIWEIVQDGTGNRTLTLASLFNLGALTITLSTTANKVDYLGAVYRSTPNKLDVIAFSAGY